MALKLRLSSTSFYGERRRHLERGKNVWDEPLVESSFESRESVHEGRTNPSSDSIAAIVSILFTDNQSLTNDGSGTHETPCGVVSDPSVTLLSKSLVITTENDLCAASS